MSTKYDSKNKTCAPTEVLKRIYLLKTRMPKTYTGNIQSSIFDEQIESFNTIKLYPSFESFILLQMTPHIDHLFY